MKTLFEFLTEGQGEISLTRKLEKSLKPETLKALNDWEYINWSSGPLENSFKKKDEIYDDLMTVFDPVREYLKKTQGPKIALYRGFGSNGDVKRGRILYSWTSRPKYAAVFGQQAMAKSGIITKLGTNSSFERFRNVTDSEIKKAEAELVSKGFTKLAGLSFKTWSDDSRFFNAYLGTREHTFGETVSTFSKWVTSRRQDVLDADKELEANGTVVKQGIPVEDIVWIFSGGRDSPGGVSMEYIVKGHDGSKGKKVDVFSKK